MKSACATLLISIFASACQCATPSPDAGQGGGAAASGGGSALGGGAGGGSGGGGALGGGSGGGSVGGGSGGGSIGGGGGTGGGSGGGGGGIVDAGPYVFDAGCDPLDGGCGFDGGVDSFCGLLAQFGCGREAQCQFLDLAQWNDCTAFVANWCERFWDPSAGVALSATGPVATCLSDALAEDCRLGRALPDIQKYLPVPSCDAIVEPKAPVGAGCLYDYQCAAGGYCPDSTGACVACTPYLDAGDPCTSENQCGPMGVCLSSGASFNCVAVYDQADGTVCGVDSVCTSRHCNTVPLDGGDTVCGPSPLGAACNVRLDCGANAYCDATKTCVPLNHPGAPCDQTIDEGETCALGTHCRGPVCVQTGTLGAGSVCKRYPFAREFECDPAYGCFTVNPNDQIFGECQLRHTKGYGCSYDYDCHAGLVCDLLGKCEPLPRSGQPCDDSPLAKRCADLLECHQLGDGGALCGPYLPVGVDCDALMADAGPNGAFFEIVCMDSLGDVGFCVPEDGGNFCDPLAPIDDGMACNDFESYDRCRSGRCRQPDGGTSFGPDAGGTCAPVCP